MSNQRYTRDSIIFELSKVSNRLFPNSSFYDILKNLDIAPSRNGYTEWERKHIVAFCKHRQQGGSIAHYQQIINQERKANVN